MIESGTLRYFLAAQQTVALGGQADIGVAVSNV